MGPEIEHRIAVLSNKPRLDIGQIDFTVNNPELVSTELGATFQYFHRVEAEVAGLSLSVLLPNSPSHYVDRFVNYAWTPDETLHGIAFGELLDVLGVDRPTVADQQRVPLHNRFVGVAGRLSQRTHEVVEMIYHTTGAVHEKLTFIGYQRLIDRLTAMGERALVATMMQPIIRDEAGHLGYYQLVVKQLKPNLAAWQQQLVRGVIRKTYAPVGAGANKDKPDFGATVQALAGDNVHRLARPIQELANSLLKIEGVVRSEIEADDTFVIDAIEECVKMAQQAA